MQMVFVVRSRAVAAIAAGVLLISSVGCAGASRRVAYSPHELRASAAVNVPPDSRGEILVPYEVTPELVERATRYVDGYTTEHGRANQLLRAITRSDGFGVEWEPAATSVPRETVERGYGNCLSLTSLYIGLARAIGLHAYYVDASDRINELSREEELLVNTGHIAATVRTERGWSMVDFSGEISSFRTFRVIDDVEALAHFYNNRGYERIAVAQRQGLEVDWNTALADFQLAGAVRPDFARAHNNRGVAYARLGRETEAEASYRAAIAADRSFAPTYHNLANLFLRRGEIDAAIEWYGVAIERESKNPYLRFHYGLALYHSGDTAGSIVQFERAIALKRDYAEPRTLLAHAYRAQGRFEEAERVQRAAGRSGQDGGR